MWSLPDDGLCCGCRTPWTIETQGHNAAGREEAIEAFARVLLRRYGVVSRRMIERESLRVSWFELIRVYRRLEARGEIRGGYFVSGLSGEQFARPEAIGLLRSIRRAHAKERVDCDQRRRSVKSRRNTHARSTRPGDHGTSHPSSRWGTGRGTQSGTSDRVGARRRGTGQRARTRSPSRKYAARTPAVLRLVQKEARQSRSRE